MSNAKKNTQELLKRIETGIKQFKDSDVYKKWLKFQSKFHRYSYNNTLLIMLQRPDATYVKGYKGWQELGRHVKKGEKGIKILAPRPYKYEKEVEKIDQKTKEVKVEKVVVEGITFRPVTVFDIKQTDGKPIPQLTKELEGNSGNTKKLIEIIKKQSKVPIEFSHIKEDGVKGYYSPSENKIVIREGMSPDQTLKTLIHEYAHSRLHQPEVLKNRENKDLITRSHIEVEAESIAFIVADHYGIDTSEYSFAYLSSWTSQDLKEVKESINIITKESHNIINEIDSKILELEKEVKIAENCLNTGLDEKETRELLADYNNYKVEVEKYTEDIEINKNKITVLNELKNKTKELNIEIIYKKGKESGWYGRLKNEDHKNKAYDGWTKIASNSTEALKEINKFAENLKRQLRTKIMEMER